MSFQRMASRDCPGAQCRCQSDTDDSGRGHNARLSCTFSSGPRGGGRCTPLTSCPPDQESQASSRCLARVWSCQARPCPWSLPLSPVAPSPALLLGPQPRTSFLSPRGQRVPWRSQCRARQDVVTHVHSNREGLRHTGKDGVACGRSLSPSGPRAPSCRPAGNSGHGQEVGGRRPCGQSLL
jgi:hypothetical protein